VDGLEDWDFWLRCADVGLWGTTIPEPLSWYRRRPDHAARWRNLARPEALAAFRARLRERHPGLYAGGFPRVEAEGSALDGALLAQELAKTGRRALVALPPRVEDAELAERVERLVREGFEVTVAVPRTLDPSTRARLARSTPDVFVLPDFLAPGAHAAFLRHIAGSRGPDLVVGGEGELARDVAREGALRGTRDSFAARLRTRAELDEIESSRSWRTVAWIAARSRPRAVGRLLLGSRSAPGGDDDPATRLARIQASPAYRWVQAAKRNPVYRLYARRRWGPDWKLARRGT